VGKWRDKGDCLGPTQDTAYSYYCRIFTGCSCITCKWLTAFWTYDDTLQWQLAIATYCYTRCAMSASLPIGLSVGHVRKPCKNGWNDRDAIWGLSWVDPRNHALDGSADPEGKGQFLGLSAPLKSIESLMQWCSVSKNGWTYQDAIWVPKWVGPELRVTWDPGVLFTIMCVRTQKFLSYASSAIFRTCYSLSIRKNFLTYVRLTMIV